MDPFDFLAQQQQQDKSTAQFNLTQQRRDPVDVARAARIAQSVQSGIMQPPPTALVEANPQPFDEAAKKAQTGSLLDENPWMAPYYAKNPDAAALTKVPEDLSKIGSIGQALGITPSSAPPIKLGGPINPLAPPTLQHTDPNLTQDPYGGVTSNGSRSYLGASAAAGYHSVLATGLEIVNDVLSTVGVTQDAGEEATLLQGKSAAEQAAIRAANPLAEGAATEQAASRQIMSEVTPEEQAAHGDKSVFTLDQNKAAYRDPTAMLGSFMQMAPMVVGLAVAGALVRKLPPDRLAAITMGLEGTTFGAQQQIQTQDAVQNQSQEKWDASPEYQQLIKSGSSPEVAKLYLAATAGKIAGIGAGLSTAAINGVGAPFLSRILGEGSGFVGNAVRGGVEGAVTGAGFGATMQASNNLGIRAAIDPNQSLTEGVGEAAGQGMLAGGITSSATRAIFGHPVEQARSIEGAVHDQTLLDHIMTASQNVEMRKHSPEEFGKMVDHAAEGGSATHVYLPIEAVDKVLADPTVPEEEKAALRVHQSQIDEARLTQGDVVMPVGEVASKLAGTKTWDMLKDDVRLQQGGISGSEAKVHMQSMIAELEKAGGDAYDQAHAAAPRLEAKQDVYTQAKAQALATGMSAKEAQTTAVLWANHADAVAHSLTRGKFADAREAWNWMDLEMKRGKADAALPPEAADLLKQDAPKADMTPLKGAPKAVDVPTLGKVPVEPIQRARQAAVDYMHNAGLAYHPPTDWAKINVTRARRLSAAFEEMKHDPHNPEVAKAYEAMKAETLSQFHEIMKTGLKVEFMPKGEDKYEATGPRGAIQDVKDNNHLWVFPTEEGFGSSDVKYKDNPLLEKAGVKLDGHEMTYNDVFRIVHDYFGHIKDGAGFRADGEENAWQSHAAMYTPLARRAMTTETRGQNSWVNFGRDGRGNRRASAADTKYADQKVGLLPEWASEEGFLGDGRQVQKDQGQGTGASANDAAAPRLSTPPVSRDGTTLGIHYSTDPGLSATDPGKWKSNLAILSREERQSKGPDRTYFGLGHGQEGGYRREWGTGDHVYTANIPVHQLYDILKDPDGLGYKALQKLDKAGIDAERPGRWLAAYEQEIKDAGHLGYWANAPQGLSAAIFHDLSVEHADPADVAQRIADGLKAQDAANEAHIVQQSAAIGGWEALSQHLTEEEKAKVRAASAEKILNIARLLPDAKEMAAVGIAGRAKRGWYESSAHAILQVFGVKDGPRFAALLAALSPQTSVESNLYNALKTWTNWNEAGRPTDRASLIKVMGDSVQGGKGVGSLLNSWINNSVTALTHPDPGKMQLSGPKVDSFMNNLLGVVDEVTNDTWMANYANVDPVIFRKTGQNKGPGYKAMNAVVRAAADHATKITGETWTPSEIQETVWSFAKTLYEARDSAGETRSMRQLLEAGHVTHNDIANTPDFATLFQHGIYKSILESAGYSTDALDGGRRAVGVDGEEGINAKPEGLKLSNKDWRIFLADAADRLEATRDRRKLAALNNVAEDKNGFPLEDVLNSNGDGTRDPTILQQFGGVVGAERLGRDGGLHAAQDMEEAGIHKDDIWRDTGWNRGDDGKWRFEIDDSEAKFRFEPSRIESPEDYVNFGDQPTMQDEHYVVEGERLRDIMQHPQLYTAYPELAKMPVYIGPIDNKVAGYFDGTKIVLNEAHIDHRQPDLESQQQSTLLHEIQHAVQMIEGFSNGTSSARKVLIELGFEQELKDTEQRFRDINNGKLEGWFFPRLLSDSEIRQAAADDLYKRAAGEVEARNTESRASLSEGMRRAIKPDALADVPPDRRLVMPQMDRTSFSEVGGDKPTENAPRGETAFFPDGRTVISLFKSDYSTMLHEMSHVFLDHMFRLADMPEASPQLKADMATLGKWFEKNGTPLNPDGSLSVPAHELFARTGERYYREGKAPSPELRDTFKQLATWLGSVYKSVKDLLAHGAAPINNEIREIMDRQLATQDAIEQNATQPMSQVELGMTDAEYGRYLASVKGARDKGYDTLLEKMMQAIRQRDQSRLKTQRDNVRASVAKEINADPKFVALHLLRTGRWLDDPSREATPVKINTGWLIDNYGEDILKQLPVGLQPLHRADGLVGDHVAELAGMKSGDDLVKSLVELKQQADALKASGNPRPLRDQMIEDETNTRMAERHGDVARSDDDIRDEAIAALNSDRQGEVLAAELRQLKKQNGQKGEVTPYSMLREWARRKVNDAKVSDATSKAALQGYTRNYNKARSLFEKALLDKDPAEALKQKQAQMINHALLAEGKKVADEIGSVVNRLKRYADTAAMSSIDQDYMDRIHELVEGYNFRNVSDKTRAAKVSFEDWAAAQRAKGEEVLVPARFRDDRMNWKDAKVAKLLELNDMVQSLVHLGKLKQTLFDKQQAKALAEVRDDAESRILNLPDRKRPDVSVGEDSRGFIKRMSDAKTFGEYRDAVANTLFKPASLRRMISGLVKPEKMFDILDGEGDGTGPLNKQMVWGASDAASKFGDVWEEVMQPMIDHLRSDGKMTARLNDKVTIKELTLNVSLHETDGAKIGEPITILRKQLLGLLLHTGNLSNLTKLVGGEKWGNHESATDIERVRNILLSYTTKEDMDLAQSMWDGVGKLWPHIAEVERQMSGVVPERVVPTPFEAHGKTYEGGYWPVIFDRDRSIMGQRAGEEAEKGLFGVGAGVGTQKGHTITRTEALAPLEWSPDNILFGHMTDAISRVAYAPWIRDSLKLVDDPRIKGAIKLKLGNEYASLIKPWMKDQIPSSYTDTKGSKAWEQAIGGIRNRMTIATLGLSYTTSLAQMLGINYVLGNLSEGAGNVGSGAKWLAKGIQEQIKQGKDGAEGPQEFVFNRSPEMARRTHEYNVEVQNAIAQLKDNDSLANRLRVKGMWHIGFVDLNMVALPAWYGAYHQGLDKGLSEEEAARYGDKIVRLSHGTGRAKDLAAISRGTAAQKFITMFYGPSSVFFNQQWAASQHIRAGNWSKALAPTFYFLAINSLAAAAIHRDLPQKDDSGDMSAANIGKWAGRNMLFGSMYGIPLVRDIADVTSRKMAGEYASYGATPISVMSDTIGKGITAARSIYNKDETTGASLKAEAQAAGFLFSIPGNQPGKTAGFLKDVYDGKEQPHSAGDWYKGLVYGSPHHARSQV